MKKTVIFLHIPKTGGTTLRSIINREYKENERLLINNYPHLPRRNGIDRIIKLDRDQKAELKFIYGHFAFGIHKYLPQESTYITFLRNPIDRIISHFYFVKKHNIKEHIGNMDGDTLEEYLEKGIKYELNNGITRLLCSNEKIQKNSTICKKDLTIAKDNLNKYFSFIGILEEFNNGLSILKNQFSWDKNLFYKKENITKHPNRKQIPDDVIKKIIRMNALDIQLYNYAKEKYIQTLKHYQTLIKP